MNLEYLKRIMVEAGLLETPSPGLDWREAEEQAWKQVCFSVGLRYTPYPDRVGQDPDLLQKIDAETLVLPMPAPVTQAVMDLKHWLPTPVKLDPETPPAVAKVFKTVEKIPASFVRPITFNDPMAGLEPNLPRVKRRPNKMDPEKAKRANAVREAETGSSETPAPGVIRVR